MILEKLHQWGGRGDDTFSADVFYFHSELWKTVTTQGAPPPRLHSAASAGSQHYLYTYGGEAEDKSLTSCLHRLDTKTSTWSQLAPHSADFSSWMIVYKNWVIVIGGVGIPLGPLQPGSKWKKFDECEGEGLTNEMHKFDLSKGKIQHYMNYHWSKIKILTLLGQAGIQTQCIKENFVIHDSAYVLCNSADYFVGFFHFSVM